MEVQEEKVHFRLKICFERNRLLDVTKEEELRSLQKIRHEGIHVMEVTKKEAVLLQVHSGHEEFASEKESHLEMEKEDATMI